MSAAGTPASLAGAQESLHDKRHLSIYNHNVIRSFRSKPLEWLFQGNPKYVGAPLRRKCENILAVLDAATDIDALNLPGFRLHPLPGDQAGAVAVTVRANWRITFRFEDSNAFEVDFEHYQGD